MKWNSEQNNWEDRKKVEKKMETHLETTPQRWRVRRMWRLLPQKFRIVQGPLAREGVVFGLGCQAWKQSTESVDGDDDCSFLWSRAGEEEWVPWSELCSWNASAGNNGAMASVIPSNCFRSPRSTPLSVCVPQRSVHPTPDTTCR